MLNPFPFVWVYFSQIATTGRPNGPDAKQLATLRDGSRVANRSLSRQILTSLHLRGANRCERSGGPAQYVELMKLARIIWRQNCHLLWSHRQWHIYCLKLLLHHQLLWWCIYRTIFVFILFDIYLFSILFIVNWQLIYFFIFRKPISLQFCWALVSIILRFKELPKLLIYFF